MFCDRCGTSLQPGQTFCSGCGRQIVGTVTQMPMRRGRVQEHLQLVGILWLAISALNAIGAVALYIVANTILARGHEAGAPGFLQPLLSVVAILIMAKAALGFVAGWGLLQREPWARILTLVLAFISLFNVPFGTAVGVYTMWVLLPGESEREYEWMTAERAAA